ncbi:uncharacterized protein [Rutidosis leptorrhynchoides]|uniref:uncharacterized protein n=1 Tax=Rutidosis leptorrhynchoides TaxID=125765 RepID=UPI003A99C752
MTTDDAKNSNKVVLGTFLVNSKPAKVLLDSGADMTYVSLTYVATLDCPLYDQDFPLQVEIAVGSRWLMGENLDCHEKFVRVRTPSGGELIVYGEARKHPVHICTYAQARRLVSSRGIAYLAHVVDTRDEQPPIKSIPVVNEFEDVFPNELPGVPPVRQVEFRIEFSGGESHCQNSLSFGTNRDA